MQCFSHLKDLTGIEREELQKTKMRKTLVTKMKHLSVSNYRIDVCRDTGNFSVGQRNQHENICNLGDNG